LLLALERRRITHPRLRTTPIFKLGLQQGFEPGEMGFNDKFAMQEIPNEQRGLEALRYCFSKIH
jgi:hypothetical protein